VKELRILITGVGSIVANSIIKSYKLITERKIFVVGVDIKDSVTTSLIDKYYKILKPSDANYIELLLNICEKEKIDFIVPLVDDELEILSINKDFFLKKNIIVCVNSIEKILLIKNKYKLYKYLEKNGLSVPKCKLIKNSQEFIVACKYLNFPKERICYKPTISSGSRGFRIIDHDMDYEQFLFREKPNSKYIDYNFVVSSMDKCKNVPEIVLMEYVSGALYNVNVLAKNGKALFMVAGKVIAFELGNTVECEIVIDEEINKYCTEVIKLLNLNGNIGIEIAYDKNKQLKIIEINPRVQGQILSSVVAGINFPYLELKMLLGEKLPKKIKIKKIKMTRYFAEQFYLNSKLMKIDICPHNKKV